MYFNSRVTDSVTYNKHWQHYTLLKTAARPHKKIKTVRIYSRIWRENASKEQHAEELVEIF